MINIVVAFSNEAKPIIDHYRLSKLKGKQAFRLFGNEQITLIISGIGKVHAAAATAYLQALTLESGPCAWLNIGIAGHGSFSIGQGFIAHSIKDERSGHCQHPSSTLPFNCQSSKLITVDQPQYDYHYSSGYDMEASAFYTIALRNSTAELVQCYKVVSDNPSQPLNLLSEQLTKDSTIDSTIDSISESTDQPTIMSKKFVAGLIQSCINEIDHVISLLNAETIEKNSL